MKEPVKQEVKAIKPLRVISGPTTKKMTIGGMKGSGKSKGKKLGPKRPSFVFGGGFTK